jgi:hypothetical protein
MRVGDDPNIASRMMHMRRAPESPYAARTETARRPAYKPLDQSSAGRANRSHSPSEMTGAAEARAKTGHDIFALPTWQVTIHKEALEPVDDLMEELTKQYGPYYDSAAYLCRHDGSWKAIVAPTGSHTKAMVSRLDLFKQHANVDL